MHCRRVISVPLTVVSPWQNRGGQWWEVAIVFDGSHVRGVLSGVLRVIYRSLYVWLFDFGQNFEEAIFLPSTSEIRETTISTSAWHLIFRHEDSVRDPRPWYCWKAENLSFLRVLLVRGVTSASFLIKKRQSWAFVLRYEVFFLTESQKDR